jgi:hypothetical protein
MKAWQDCQWKRDACGRDDCPICGPIKRQRAEHIAKGEDPDSVKAALADVSKNFQEMVELLTKMAKEKGIDLTAAEGEPAPEPPLPIDYPLYNKIMDWRQGIYDIAEASDITSDAWLYTEAGEDLMWYASTLLVKVYRQLTTIWRIQNGRGEFLDLEYKYTGYVIGQVLKILDKALLELSTNGGAHAKEFAIARLSFDAIKQEILDFVVEV